MPNRNTLGGNTLSLKKRIKEAVEQAQSGIFGPIILLFPIYAGFDPVFDFFEVFLAFFLEMRAVFGGMALFAGVKLLLIHS